MIRLTPEKLSFHFIWIFGLLEMITVPLVAWFPDLTSIGVKSPLEGAMVGFIGIIILFRILNSILPRLRLKIEGQTVTRISILPSAVWNTLFLALIFAIQKLVCLIPFRSWILQEMLTGFVSTFGAVFITLFIYHEMCKNVLLIRISIKTSGSRYTIKIFSILTLAIMAGVYEAIALPVILIWQKVTADVVLVAVLTGFTGGVLGCCVVVFYYNYIRFPRLFLNLEKMENEKDIAILQNQ